MKLSQSIEFEAWNRDGRPVRVAYERTNVRVSGEWREKHSLEVRSNDSMKTTRTIVALVERVPLMTIDGVSVTAFAGYEVHIDIDTADPLKRRRVTLGALDASTEGQHAANAGGGLDGLP